MIKFLASFEPPKVSSGAYIFHRSSAGDPPADLYSPRAANISTGVAPAIAATLRASKRRLQREAAYVAQRGQTQRDYELEHHGQRKPIFARSLETRTSLISSGLNIENPETAEPNFDRKLRLKYDNEPHLRPCLDPIGKPRDDEFEPFVPVQCVTPDGSEDEK